MVSLGNVARSTTRTRYPFRANSMAVGEPAQRSPTTIASYDVLVLASPRWTQPLSLHVDSHSGRVILMHHDDPTIASRNRRRLADVRSGRKWSGWRLAQPAGLSA